MLTVKDAATTLGVTPQRVTQLIASGNLEATRMGSQWLVDEDSVAARARGVRKRGGRPAVGSGKNDDRFTLMNRTHAICTLVYNRAIRAFTHVGELIDEARAPIGVLGGTATDSYAITDWWRGKGIPDERSGLRAILDDAGVNVPEELVMRSLGLSLSDQYWICPEGSGLRWEDINFFHHDFTHVADVVAPYTSNGTGTGANNDDQPTAGAHPDNTSDGNLAKHWVVRDGVRVLLKDGGRLCQEPYNEVVATALHARLLGDGEYVPYTLDGTGANAKSACADFLNDDEEYVPAIYVSRVLPQRSDQSDYQQYLACCAALGVEGVELALWKMMVCDDIIANADRHWRNFGLVRNVETLACRPAPIFDSGSSLWVDVSLDDLRRGEFSFHGRQFDPNPGRQLLLVSDMGWFESAWLDGFVGEAIGILGDNPLLAERLPYVECSLARRIDRIVDIRDWS